MDSNTTRSRQVSIDAKPGPITIDVAATAALVVDMQNDFATKGGMFERAGIDISITRAAIEPTARALAAVRQAGITVIYLKMGYRSDLADLGPPDSPNRTQAGSGRYRRLQDAVQRVLRNGHPIHSQDARHQVFGGCGSDHIRLRRFDDSRCHVQRLCVRPVGRLHRGAHRQPVSEK
jgi:hypothetical protein